MLLQYAAATVAFNLISITKRHFAWVLITIALLLMAFWRTAALYRMLLGDLSLQVDLLNEVFVLAVSLLILVGLARIGTYFRALQRSCAEARQQTLALRQHVSKRTDDLGKSVTVYRQFLEALPHGVEECDTKGVITFCNEARHKMLGYQPGQLTGKSILDFEADDPLELKKHLARLADEQPEPEPQIRRNRTRDGRVIDVRVDWVYNLGASGEVLGFTSIVTDITTRKRTEGALRESEKRYRKLIYNMDEGISIVDDDETFLFANPACDRIFGVTAGSLVGRSLHEFVDQDGLKAVREQSEARRRGLSGAYDLTIRRADGARRVLRISASPHRDAEGSFGGTLGLIQDITERERAEKLLRVQRDLGVVLASTHGLEEALSASLTAAIEASDMDCGGIYLVDPDSGALGLVAQQGWSKPFAAILRYLPAASAQAAAVRQGEAVYDRYEDFGVLPEDRRRAERLRAVATVPVRHKKQIIASLVVASRALDDVAPACRTALEAIVGQIGVGIARAQAAEELEQSVARFRTVVDASKDAMIAIDKQGLVSVFNPAAETMFGWSQEEMLGQPLDMLMPAEYREKHTRYVKSYFSSGEPHGAVGQTLELPAVRRDGVNFPVELSLSVGRYNGQQFVLAVIRDITQRKRAQEALREGEERYRRLVLNMGEGVGIVDEAEEFVFTNPAAERIFGAQPGELVGRNLRDFVAEAEFNKVLTETRTRREGQTSTYELAITRADGEQRHLLATVNPYLDAESKYHGAHGIFLDITERKQAEQMLRRLNEELEQRVAERTEELRRFATLADLVPVPLWIFDSNLDTVYCNSECKRFGAGGTVGANLAQFGRDTREVLEPLLRDCLAESAGQSFEGWVASAPGADSYWNVICVPLREDLVACEILDWTVRKEAEQALKESEERHRTLVETMPDGLAVQDKRDVITYANDSMCRMLGLSRDELVGYPVGAFLDEANRRVLEEQTALRAAGKSGSYELTWRHKHGHDVITTVSPAPVVDAAGNFLGSFAVITDITDRKRAVEALRASELRFRAIVEDQTELICRFQLDGTLTFVNETYCRTFSQRREELVGHRFLPLVSEEDRPLVQRMMSRLSFANPVISHEHRVVLADGSVRWQEWTNRALFDEEGNIREIQAVGRDITERKLAGQALRESEERLNLALEGAADSIWDYNVVSGQVYRSPRMAALLGYEPEEIEGSLEGWEELIHPDDRGQVDQALEAHLEGNTPAYATEYRIRGKSGDWHWVLDTGKVVLRDENGRPLRVAGTHKDVDARRRAAQALAESEERYRSLVDDMVEGLVVNDRESAFVFANAAAEHLFGVGPGELVGRKSYEFIRPQDRTVWEAQLDMRRAGQVTSYEVKIVDAQGRVKHLLVTATPRLDDEGNYDGAQALLQDITERKHAEEALRESEERFRSTFEEAAVGMAVSTLEGELTKVNSALCEMLGYTEEELLGLNIGELTPSDEFEEETAKMKQLIGGEINFFLAEKRYIHRRGNPLWAILSASIVRDKRGEPLYVIGQIQDISERKRAEEEREKLIADLQQALAEVKRLHGLLPICASCKKVRDDEGYWNQLDRYISEHSDVKFTHGLCPECVGRLYPDLVDTDVEAKKPPPEQS